MTEYRIVERHDLASRDGYQPGYRKQFSVEYKGWFGIWHHLEFYCHSRFDSKEKAQEFLDAWLTPKIVHEYKGNV